MFNTLVLISVFTVMLVLKSFVSILPSVLVAALRWKENINIEASVKTSRDRDFSALVLIIPFCLTVFRFRIYDPKFISGLPDNPRLLSVIGIFVLYLLIRKATSTLIQPQSIPQKTYAAAEKSANTFFIILTLALLSLCSISSFCGVDLHTIKVLSLWLSALIYGLYALRKLQIFTASCSLFAGFLYLCALEILPTVILVASDVIF